MELVGFISRFVHDIGDVRCDGAGLVVTRGRQIEEVVDGRDIVVPRIDGIDHAHLPWIPAAAIGADALCISEGRRGGGRGANESKNRGGNEGLRFEVIVYALLGLERVWQGNGRRLTERKVSAWDLDVACDGIMMLALECTHLSSYSGG